MELHLILLEQNSLPIQNTSKGATDMLWHLNSNNADVKAKLKMCCILETICALRLKKRDSLAFGSKTHRYRKKKQQLITYMSTFLVEPS